MVYKGTIILQALWNEAWFPQLTTYSDLWCMPLLSAEVMRPFGNLTKTGTSKSRGHARARSYLLSFHLNFKKPSPTQIHQMSLYKDSHVLGGKRRKNNWQAGLESQILQFQYYMRRGRLDSTCKLAGKLDWKRFESWRLFDNKMLDSTSDSWIWVKDKLIRDNPQFWLFHVLSFGKQSPQQFSFPCSLDHSILTSRTAIGLINANHLYSSPVSTRTLLLTEAFH